MSASPSFPLPDSFGTDVVVYLTPGCPYCMMARRLLSARQIPYEVYDVSGNHGARAWLRDNTQQHTVPQIFIKGRSVGGFDQLSQLDKRGELPAWLESK